MPATITAKQYIVLRFYYSEGWTERRIGTAMGISHQAVHNLLVRGRRWVFDACDDQGVANSPIVEVLFAPSITASPTRDLGLAAARQEDLLDALELLMERRAIALATAEGCMSNGHFLPAHVKRNTLDQWEMQYALRHHCRDLPSSAYNAAIAARYSGVWHD